MNSEKDCPASVRRGVTLLWTTLAVTMIGVVVDRFFGMASKEEFVALLLLYSLLSFFPYKIGQGSTFARTAYAVMLIASSTYAVGTGFAGGTQTDVILSIVLVPFELYAAYCFFTAEANQWFSARRETH